MITLHLKDYLRIARRRWIAIVVCALLGLAGGGAAAMLTTPVYTSQTQLFVASGSTETILERQQSSLFILSRTHSYVGMASTPTVLQPAIAELGLDMTPSTLAEHVNASVDSNTVLITLEVTDGTPQGAADLATAVSESLVAAVDDVEGLSSDGDPLVSLTVVTPATLPALPSQPNVPLSLGLGLLIGLAVGILSIFTADALDNRVRGKKDLLQVTDAPVLGGIPFDRAATRTPIHAADALQGLRAQCFRKIRTNLQFAQFDRQVSSVLVTSSVADEGKSTTAASLALALADEGHSVVLVDADLRRPSMAKFFGLPNRTGLTTALMGEEGVDDLLRPLPGNAHLRVLTTGKVPPNPSELLASQAMRRLVAHLESAFDYVVIDAPPLLSLTDAAILSQQAGGVVMVVGSGQVQAAELEESMSTLRIANAELLGVVLNRLPRRGPDADRYGSYYLAEAASAAPAARAAEADQPAGL